MNIYVVCEGEVGERKVYRDWIPRVNHNLSYVSDLNDIVDNHFSIIVGGGDPRYYDVIENAIEDVNNHGNIDRLIIAVDSEELDYQEKYDEISDFISDFTYTSEIHIVIQHFCLETWALGNKHIVKPSPHCSILREYKNFFDVRLNDPELLTSPKPDYINRAQFAEKYLRRVLNEKFRRLTYTKSNPDVLLNQKYFEQVKQRYIENNHIISFNHFLNAFS